MTGLFDIVEIQPAAGVENMLAALHAACFCRPGDETWTAKSFADVMGMAGAFCLLARQEHEDGAEPIGFAVCRTGGGESELLSIGVIPEHRQSGTARSLIARSMDMCRRAGARHLTLEVATDNPLARDLYVSLGFQAVGRRAGYYRRLQGRRVDAITMRRSLDAAR